MIDESQDFTENFFELCDRVTEHNVYIAGDIFQNVFESTRVSEVEPQFLLNKCYRTDPKTLMAAHAIGMGLFEDQHHLRWLEDKAWNDCGYEIKRENGYCNLYRKPLRRFEDLGDVSISSLKILPTDKELYYSKIIEIINEIKEKHETVKPDDIGIIFLENINENYRMAELLRMKIMDEYGWDVNIGYESKEKRKNTLFISNRNNVKGLEFPFVIVFMQNTLSDRLQLRNSVYMMLTRSFITSYLILPDDNSENLKEIMKGVEEVNKNGYLHVKEPDEREKQRLNNAKIKRTHIFKSQKEIVDEIFSELKIEDKEKCDKLRQVISVMYSDELDKDKLHELIAANYNLMD